MGDHSYLAMATMKGVVICCLGLLDGCAGIQIAASKEFLQQHSIDIAEELETTLVEQDLERGGADFGTYDECKRAREGSIDRLKDEDLQPQWDKLMKEKKDAEEKYKVKLQSLKDKRDALQSAKDDKQKKKEK